MARITALIFAYIFLALAFVGVFLPGLPTVPFLLLAAWCAARGSDKLHSWLYAHPRLGKLLIDWELERAISRSSKVLAILMLIISWFVMYFRLNNLWLLSGLAVLFVTVAAYLVSRPEPKQGK
jgi:hypothetical protein